MKKTTGVKKGWTWPAHSFFQKKKLPARCLVGNPAFFKELGFSGVCVCVCVIWADIQLNWTVTAPLQDNPRRIDRPFRMEAQVQIERSVPWNAKQAVRLRAEVVHT